MFFNEIRSWLQIPGQAPAEIRAYVESLIWLLISLVLVSLILRILFSAQFKELYRVLGTGLRLIGKGGIALARSAATGLELPEPYPRIDRLGALFFMIVSYLASFTLATLVAVLVVVAVLYGSGGFWARTAWMLVIFFFFLFARFTFADAERQRLKLFPKKARNDDS